MTSSQSAVRTRLTSRPGFRAITQHTTHMEVEYHLLNRDSVGFRRIVLNRTLCKFTRHCPRKLCMVNVRDVKQRVRLKWFREIPARKNSSVISVTITLVWTSSKTLLPTYVLCIPTLGLRWEGDEYLI